MEGGVCFHCVGVLLLLLLWDLRLGGEVEFHFCYSAALESCQWFSFGVDPFEDSSAMEESYGLALILESKALRWKFPAPTL